MKRANPYVRRVPDKDRVRVSKACAACRGRKVRCVPRPVGACASCEAHKRECIFEEIPHNGRSQSAKGKCRDDESGDSPAEGDPRTRQDAEVRVLGDFAGSPVESFYSKRNPESPDSRQVMPQDTEANGELEGAVLLVEEQGRTQYTGLRSNESFLLCVRDVLQAERNGKTTDITSSRRIDGSLTPPQPLQSKEVLQALEEFPPQSIANFLVSTFFYYVEATFCYCDRDWFLQTLNSVYNGTASPSMADEGFVCFALLVFAFGSQFAHLRSNTDAQDLPLPLISDPGRRFYDISQALIPRVISKCTMKGIQVCLLVGLYNLPSNLPDTSYLYLGIAMRMAIASGLHRATNAARLDERLLEVRNRLWWSLYCIDRRTSIALGRPASIAEDAIDAPFPKYNHSLDEIEYRSNFQHQIEYIKLTKIVNRIMRDIPLEAKPKSITEISAMLKQWRSELFSNLHPNDLLPGERNFRTTIHLQVHYHWAWIRMGRASLLQTLRERIRAATGESPGAPAEVGNRRDLMNLCVDAAKATIQLQLVLKQHQLLSKFSFTDHQPTTAALIILVLDSILKECPDTSDIIRDGLEMLRFMAHGGCRGAKSDLQTVEQLSVFAGALRKKITRENRAGHDESGYTAVSADTSSGDAYQAWLLWMSERNDGVTIDSPQRLGAAEYPIANGGYSSDLTNFNSTSTSVAYSNPQSNLNLSFLDRDMGFGDVSNLGFDWGNGRLDMLDVSQLLSGSGYFVEEPS